MRRKHLIVASTLIILPAVLQAEKRFSVQVSKDPFLEKSTTLALIVVTESLDSEAIYEEAGKIVAGLKLTGAGGTGSPFHLVDSRSLLFEAGILDPGELEPAELMEKLGVEALMTIEAEGGKRVTHHDKRIDANVKVVLRNREKVLVLADVGMLAHGLQKPSTVVLKGFRRVMEEVAAQYRANGNGYVSLQD